MSATLSYLVGYVRLVCRRGCKESLLHDTSTDANAVMFVLAKHLALQAAMRAEAAAQRDERQGQVRDYTHPHAHTHTRADGNETKNNESSLGAFRALQGKMIENCLAINIYINLNAFCRHSSALSSDTDFILDINLVSHLLIHFPPLL